MPKMQFETVEPVEPKDSVLGSRRSSHVKDSFSSSPLYKGDLTAAERRKTYFDGVISGDVEDSILYYGFDKAVNLDFSGAPSYDKVSTGGGGLPATPFVPNPASPGASGDGSTNLDASKIPKSTNFADAEKAKTPNNFGSGPSVNSAKRDPSYTSKFSNLNSALTLATGQSTVPDQK